MGSMKQKKRKKRLKLWEQLREELSLSDEDTALLRETGYPLAKIQRSWA